MAVILVVEDELLLRAMVESILQDAEHQTVSAASAAEAILLLQSDRKIDVLFTDLGLGDGLSGGIQLAVAARQLRPQLSVLYTTGQRVSGDMTTALVEPHEFLEKPYAADQLSAALDNSLRQGRALS